MLRGLYTAATGMATQRSKMDVVTNNIVNAQTVGFKKDGVVSASFESVMLEEINGANVLNVSKEVGPYSFGTHVDSVYTNFEQGGVEATGAQPDLAISGEGFFAVETPGGESYTRSGDFDVDMDGYLVTDEGYYVQGENGRINVGAGDFTVDTTGTVAVEGNTVDTLRIVTFADAADLRKQGENLYSANGAEAIPAEDYKISQGYLENANVNIGTEMVDMLTTYRAYEASQKILTMTDDTLGLAVNDLGRVR